jgi:hypothetical protein
MGDMPRRKEDLGVLVPKRIILFKQLSREEKAVLIGLRGLELNEHGSFASNRYLSEFFGFSARQAQNHIAALKRKGFIKVTLRKGTHRLIRVKGKWPRQ